MILFAAVGALIISIGSNLPSGGYVLMSNRIYGNIMLLVPGSLDGALVIILLVHYSLVVIKRDSCCLSDKIHRKFS